MPFTVTFAIVNSSPCVEITARLVEGDRWKLSASPLTVSVSRLLLFSSLMMSILSSVVRPVATSSFHRPKFSS